MNITIACKTVVPEPIERSNYELPDCENCPHCDPLRGVCSVLRTFQSPCFVRSLEIQHRTADAPPAHFPDEMTPFKKFVRREQILTSVQYKDA